MAIVKKIDHSNPAFTVLEATVEGCPQVTRRRTILTRSLRNGALQYEDESAALAAEVDALYEDWQYQQGL